MISMYCPALTQAGQTVVWLISSVREREQQQWVYICVLLVHFMFALDKNQRGKFLTTDSAIN